MLARAPRSSTNCWNALEDVNDTQQVADAMAFLADLADVIDGATAMVAALQRYVANISVCAPQQTERGGYWPDATSASPSGQAARKELPRPGTPPDATVCKEGRCQFGAVQAAVDAALIDGTSIEFRAPPDALRIVDHKPAMTSRDLIQRSSPTPSQRGELMAAKPVPRVHLNSLGHRPWMTAFSRRQIPCSFDHSLSLSFVTGHGASGDGFMARDLTFANAAGPDKQQAVAFGSDSDLSALESVEFLGHRDTLYKQFYKSCRISGTVDFIFGNFATVPRACLARY
ncbi:pectinesterase [Musa troglodytarum]|uniref:Pectinesterase n=1 Tax=Musa troglodytarum TaxID=320322 RepID=A0A9E7EBD5_9LILI|nr:pectinesterase [Musa troglodytarum]